MGNKYKKEKIAQGGVEPTTSQSLSKHFTSAYKPQTKAQTNGYLKYMLNFNNQFIKIGNPFEVNF